MASPVPSCPTLSNKTRKNLCRRLFKLGSINFDGVPLKTGEISPVYFDIRLTMSDPALLQELSREMYKMVCEISKDSFDLVAGVPAAAVALATEISVQSNIPQILCRKTTKDYGTKRVIEGIWQKGQNTLMVEDVVTYGDSIAECSGLLRDGGLTVRHACVVVERQQGATQQLLKNHNIQLHSLLTFDDLLNTLLADGLITPERVETVRKFNAVWQYETIKEVSKPVALEFCPSLADKLTKIIRHKATNVCLSIGEMISTERLVELVSTAAPYVAAIQINMHCLTDYSSTLAEKLCQLAKRQHFILIGDYNLCDEKIASLMLNKASHVKLSDWCDVITVHGLFGKGVFEALRQHNSTAKRPIAALLISDLSYYQIDSSYQTLCSNIAKAHKDICLGFVSTTPIEDLPHVTNEDGVPNAYYLVPAPLHHISTNGDAPGVRTFGDCPKGVLFCVNLSDIEELDTELSILVKESYKIAF